MEKQGKKNKDAWRLKSQDESSCWAGAQSSRVDFDSDVSHLYDPLT